MVNNFVLGAQMGGVNSECAMRALIDTIGTT